MICFRPHEEFASKLRRIRYPFNDNVSTSSIEIWHSVHAEFEIRAPIIRQNTVTFKAAIAPFAAFRRRIP
jgi:hypothetical protein